MWMGSVLVSECGFHSKCRKRQVAKSSPNRCNLKAKKPKQLPTIRRLVQSTKHPLKAQSRFLTPNEYPSWIPKDNGWRAEHRSLHGNAGRIDKYYWPPNAKWGLTSRSSVLKFLDRVGV